MMMSSVCLSVAKRAYVRSCMKTTSSINVQIYDNVGTMKVDYRMQYYDITTNPRWPIPANMKALC